MQGHKCTQEGFQFTKPSHSTKLNKNMSEICLKSTLHTKQHPKQIITLLDPAIQNFLLTSSNSSIAFSTL